MKLEDEIKQNKPFESPSAKLIVNIMHTNSWVTSNIKAQLKPFGVTMKQYNILRILKGSQTPLSTSEIQERMIDNMSDVTRLIDRLIKKEYANRKPRKKDKRLVDITLSYKGAQLVNRIASNTTLDGFAQTLSENDTIKLNELLDQLRN